MSMMKMGVERNIKRRGLEKDDQRKESEGLFLYE